MKATELMIDDWVLHEGEPYQIRQLGIYGENRDGEDYPAVCVGKPKGIGLIVERNEIEPITLTAEILEKNGFIKQSFDEWMLRTENYSIMWRIVYGEPNLNIDSWSAYYGTFHKFGISFVHELQHALRLCNIEKKIEL